MPQASEAVEAEGNLRRTILWGTQWGQLDGPAGFSLSLRTGLVQRAGRFGAPTYQLLGLRAHRVTSSPHGPLGSRRQDSYLVDSASSHMLVSKIKPCMSKYKQNYTVKLRMAH